MCCYPGKKSFPEIGKDADLTVLHRRTFKTQTGLNTRSPAQPFKYKSHVLYQVPVTTYTIRSHQTCDKGRFTVCPRGVYTWCIHVIFPRGMSTWLVHAGCPRGVSTWHVHVLYPRGMSTWYVHVACPRGVSTRIVHVVCPCGVYTWHFHVVYPRGVSTWCVHQISKWWTSP